MATRVWLDQNGDWNDTVNWKAALKPASGDTAIMSGKKIISAGVDQSAVNNVTLITTPQWTGQIGTPSAPLKLGTGTKVRIASPYIKGLYFHPSTADVVNIIDGGSAPRALQFVNGTVTAMNVVKAGGLVLGGALTMTTLRLLARGFNDVVALLESGLTITTAEQNQGQVTCQCEIANVYMNGGLWLHNGPASDNDITGELELRSPDAVFKWEADNSTIADMKGKRGLVDARGFIGEAMVLTAGEAWTGFAAELGTGEEISTTAAIKLRGGVVNGGPNVDTDKSEVAGVPMAA